MAVLVLGACQRPQDTSSVGTDGPVLVRGIGGEPETLDPAKAEDEHAFHVLYDLYEGLTSTAADGSLLPGAASEWVLSDDGLRYTFSLRDNARWSNGEPVTAAQFVAGIRRSLRPDTASSYAFLLFPIRNAEAVNGGTLAPDEIGVRATDTRTVVIELDAPAPQLAGVLSMPVAFPIYDAAAAGDPAIFSSGNRFVGNGAYVLENWSPMDRISARKNSHYHAAATVAINRIEYLPVSEPQTEFSLYRTDALHVTATVPPSEIAQLRKTRAGELHLSPTLGLYYLAFDLTEPMFEKLDLRRALSMAIDREQVASLLGRGEVPAYSLVPPGVRGHKGIAYDWRNLNASDRMDEARRHYASAGYGPGKPLRLMLTYDIGDIHEKVALAVSGMWRDVLGAEMVLEAKEWKVFLATRDDREAWQMMRFAWQGDYDDASTFTDLFRSDNPQNLPRYSNDTYDGLLDLAKSAVDPVERSALLTRAEQQLLGDYPIVPIYFIASKHLVSPRVENFQPNVLDRNLSRHLSLKPVGQ